jgi:predicted RNA-binding protein associated with RNAse of E/G family
VALDHGVVNLGAPGRPVLHRHFVGERLTFMRMAHLVAQDDRGLRLWVPHGTPMVATMTADGMGLRDMPFADWVQQDTTLTRQAYRGPNIFMFLPPGQRHSVWWFWDPAWTFVGWYINLEEPAVTWDDGTAAGVDIVDQDLDVWVRPDRTWFWKDDDELTERLGFPDHYWVSDPDAVWSEGRRMAAIAESGTFPFDGTWCDFRPDPDWSMPLDLPAGWDRPRVRR